MNPAEQAGVQERIARAKSGDADAWGELYRLYAPAIFRFCRRAMPTREDAEDATMDIFIKVRQKLSQYDASRPFSAWLYTVAANHCWDLLRRRKVRQDLETGEIENMPLEHPDPGQLEQLIEKHTSQEVRRALDHLPDAFAHGAGAALLRGDELRRNCRHAGRAPHLRGSGAAAGAPPVARHPGRARRRERRAGGTA